MIKIQSHFNGALQSKAFNEALKRFDAIALKKCIKHCSKSDTPFYRDFNVVDARTIEMLESRGVIITKSSFSKKKKGTIKFSKWELHVLKQIEISFLNYARMLLNEFKKKGYEKQIIKIRRV